MAASLAPLSCVSRCLTNVCRETRLSPVRALVLRSCFSIALKSPRQVSRVITVIEFLKAGLIPVTVSFSPNRPTFIDIKGSFVKVNRETGLLNVRTNGLVPRVQGVSRRTRVVPLCYVRVVLGREATILTFRLVILV